MEDDVDVVILRALPLYFQNDWKSKLSCRQKQFFLLTLRDGLLEGGAHEGVQLRGGEIQQQHRLLPLLLLTFISLSK